MPSRQDRSANSIGWPIARSVAIDRAAMISPRRTPEREDGTDINRLYDAAGWSVQLHLLGLAGARLPGHQAALDRADGGVEGEREGRQHQDAGEHGVDVEGALGLQDQVADAARGAEIFADNGADEGEADGVVQAREHPAHR